MKTINTKINKFIVPCKMVFKNQIYKLTKVDLKFIIKGYNIKIINNKIDSITLMSPHPNANPRNGEFCIPNKLRKIEITEDNKNSILKMVEMIISTFNLDDCYFTPWTEIKYEDLEENRQWKIKTI